MGGSPQIEIMLQVRRGEMNVFQDAQPNPGSGCQEARGSLASPEGQQGAACNSMDVEGRSRGQGAADKA